MVGEETPPHCLALTLVTSCSWLTKRPSTAPDLQLQTATLCGEPGKEVSSRTGRRGLTHSLGLRYTEPKEGTDPSVLELLQRAQLSSERIPTCTNLRQDKKQKSDHLLCKKLFPSLLLTFPLTWCQSDFPLSSSACLATACLEGAGPLASLAACDSSTLLCASFHSGIHVLQLRHCEELEEVAVF